MKNLNTFLLFLLAIVCCYAIQVAGGGIRVGTEGVGVMKSYGKEIVADDGTVDMILWSANGVAVVTVVSDGDTSQGACMWHIQGDANTVKLISDTQTPPKCATSDTDGRMCMIADGDGTYTFKNRLGSEETFIGEVFGLGL